MKLKLTFLVKFILTLTAKSETDDKARALYLRPHIALGTTAGSTDLENAEKD